ncbi:MAG: type II secretion system F family protein [Corynebacterium sp.]|nr:type II secretion system F family protein [Corynebacterium sp.]
MSWILIALGVVIFPRPVGRIVPHARKPRADPHTALDTAANIELFCTALEAGLHPASAAGILARASKEGEKQAWQQVAYLLERGNQECWNLLPEDYSGLGRLMRNARHGAEIAKAGARLVAEVRDRAEVEMEERSAKAGVLIALPLTLCYLPAFIVLGLVPIIVNLL